MSKNTWDESIRRRAFRDATHSRNTRWYIFSTPIFTILIGVFVSWISTASTGVYSGLSAAIIAYVVALLYALFTARNRQFNELKDAYNEEVSTAPEASQVELRGDLIPGFVRVVVLNLGEEAAKFQADMNDASVPERHKQWMPYPIPWEGDDAQEWKLIAPGGQGILTLAQHMSQEGREQRNVLQLKRIGSIRRSTPLTVRWGDQAIFEIEVRSERLMKEPARKRFVLKVNGDGSYADFAEN